MVFPTIGHLRQAIQEYIIHNKVPIKYAKNDKQRIRAHCDEDCSWFLFAALDSRTQSWVVKNFIGQHTCSREWELKQFTAKYLAARYIESFRANDKMSLKNFARIVRLDFNMTPFRSKLQRARRLAMKKIHGDELKQYNMLWDYSAENFAKKWKGDVFKNKLWAIARSYTHADWMRNMEEMKLHMPIWRYILDARELPILSMLEKIKNKLMTRFYSKNKECEEWAGNICPKIRKKLDK
ncbi:uncharacterized protein LOC104585551 [Brachypodium distachyon]|uniref:uncharacterized protein LOC104585551 n=1 Tax=Brachypodium distachyon TaxID=15368 RepID=UPI00052FE3D3|nr:uncharacterized protein LOC104585551 [Brachypodium distachyon]|eukprot:XP_010240776.1 uncharacterized protein LOC104585551 [Brachypodium distachyon]